jgi:hypothetical protein
MLLKDEEMKRGRSWRVLFLICAFASLARGQAVVSGPDTGTSRASAQKMVILKASRQFSVRLRQRDCLSPRLIQKVLQKHCL